MENFFSHQKKTFSIKKIFCAILIFLQMPPQKRSVLNDIEKSSESEENIEMKMDNFKRLRSLSVKI
jgi:hypothetical protein